MNKIKSSESIKAHILEKIERGEVRQHPRGYYAALGFLAALCAILALITVVYLVSFAMFATGTVGGIMLLAFGARGVLAFLLGLPWVIIILALSLLLLIRHLSLRYRIVYSRPTIFILTFFVALIIGGGSVLARTSLHAHVMDTVRGGGRPPMHQLYRHYDEDRPPIHQGIVESVLGDRFKVRTPSGVIYNVIVEAGVHMPVKGMVATGTQVLIAGDIEGETIHAFGIRPRQGAGFRPRPMRPEMHDRRILRQDER